MPLNLVFGWIWILAGFLSGTAIGLGFHRDGWLGGYASHERRMIRLGHVSFLGLGILNILFALGAPRLLAGGGWATAASIALVVGGMTMPLCCALMAWKRALQPLFAVPVASLVLSAAIVVVRAVRP
jgi:hypothetical protein